MPVRFLLVPWCLLLPLLGQTRSASGDSLLPVDPILLGDGLAGGSNPPDIAEPQTQPIGPVPTSPLEWPRATDGWFGARQRLEEAGIAINARLAADYSKVFSGGASPGGTAFRHLFQLNTTINLERLLGLRNATLFSNFQNQSGDDGSRDVGDIQRYSNIDADGRTQLSELWYEHALFNDKLRVRVGKIDPNATFAAPLNGGEFINSSPGISPTIIVPHYPDPATGAQVIFAPSERFYIGGGAFDGSEQEGVHIGSYGPSHLYGPPADLSLILEGGVLWGTALSARPGRLALGAWHHTGTFAHLNDTGAEHGTTGFLSHA